MAFDAIEFLEYFGFRRIKDHDEYNVMASCFNPEMHSHDDVKRSFGILKKDRPNPDGTVTPAGTANCYVCGGWSLEQLTRDLLNKEAEMRGEEPRYTEYDALKFLQEKGWLPDEDLSVEDLRREFENMEGIEFVDTLEEFKEKKYYDESILNEYKGKIHKRTLQRGQTANAITVEMAKKFELGYDNRTKRIIIPVRDMNKGLVGVISRAVNDNDFIRYGVGTINPEWALSQIQNTKFEGDKMLYTFDKREYVYGEHLWKSKFEQILVLESPLDVVYAFSQGLHEFMNIGAIFGSKVTDEQIQKIVKHHKFVVEGLDNDEPGKEGKELFYKKVRYFRPDVELYFTDSWGKKDLGECTPDEVQTLAMTFKKYEEGLFDLQPMT